MTSSWPWAPVEEPTAASVRYEPFVIALIWIGDKRANSAILHPGERENRRQAFRMSWDGTALRSGASLR
jgi:hypothetical protein